MPNQKDNKDIVTDSAEHVDEKDMGEIVEEKETPKKFKKLIESSSSEEDNAIEDESDSDDSDSDDEEDEDDDVSDQELMDAIKSAMMRSIVMRVIINDEDDDDDEDYEEDSDDEDDSEEEEDDDAETEKRRKEMMRKSKSSKTSKKKNKVEPVNVEVENSDNDDEVPTPQVAPKNSDRVRESKPRKSKDIANRRIQDEVKKMNKKESKESKEKTKSDTVKTKENVEKVSKTSKKNTTSEKTKSKTKSSDSSDSSDSSKSSKTTDTTTEAFDFEKAMSEFKSFMTTKDDMPAMMKSKFETLEKEYKKREHKKKMKEQRRKTVENTKKFRELLRKKQMEDEITFFRKLPVEKQEKYLTEFRRLKDASSIKQPYTIKLLDSPIPVEFKSIAFKKVMTLESMEPGYSEYFKVKQWVDTFMQIPFGVNHSLPVSLEVDGVEKCNEFMTKAKETLDNSVYGLNDAKMQIMQLLGQLMTNPASVGTAIAIKGYMGTGKTTLVKEGISKVLGRPFVFIPLGGATDSSFLEGHSYTYEGSTWGRIVDAIVQCKCMNPVFYFDELDKVSKTSRGDEIIGILTHLTDTTQNTQYHDKYFADLDFDLSKALFIFSYNEEDKVNPILRDRMYCIETKGYEKKDKMVIARKYLIPKIIENVRFKPEDIEILDETLEDLIDHHTDDEKGVRNLKRCLETIYTKLNLYRLMPKGVNMFDDKMQETIEFPYKVTVSGLKSLLRKGDEKQSFMSMYM